MMKKPLMMALALSTILGVSAQAAPMKDFHGQRGSDKAGSEWEKPERQCVKRSFSKTSICRREATDQNIAFNAGKGTNSKFD